MDNAQTRKDIFMFLSGAYTYIAIHIYLANGVDMAFLMSLLAVIVFFTSRILEDRNTQ